jgi:hypothetical protein
MKARNKPAVVLVPYVQAEALASNCAELEDSIQDRAQLYSSEPVMTNRSSNLSNSLSYSPICVMTFETVTASVGDSTGRGSEIVGFSERLLHAAYIILAKESTGFFFQYFENE